MPEITIYTKGFCPHCEAAKALLTRKAAAFVEVKVDADRAAQALMAARAGGRSTVPQIFIDERHIGGCDDLYALEASGHLDPLLAPSR
jgi:glutaredoxin 3